MIDVLYQGLIVAVVIWTMALVAYKVTQKK